MELIDFLKSQLLIEKARLEKNIIIWGVELSDKYCAADRAVVAEIERQIYEIEGEI